MLRKIDSYFDIRTFFLTCGVSFLWIIISDFIVNYFLSPEAKEVAQYIKGLAFVFLVSVVLSIFHGIQKRALSDRQKDFDRLFRESFTPTLLVNVDTNEIVEANRAALNIMGCEEKDILHKPLQKIFPDLDKWKHVLLGVATAEEGNAQLKAQLHDFNKELSDVDIQVSHFQFNHKETYLISMHKMGTEWELAHPPSRQISQVADRH